MIQRVGKKVKSKKGESLVETLAALVISTLGLMILAGALVAASKVNYGIENTYTFMVTQKKGGGGSSTVSDNYQNINIKPKSGDASSITAKVSLYSDEYTVGEEKIYYYYWIPTITEENAGQNSGG